MTDINNINEAWDLVEATTSKNKNWNFILDKCSKYNVVQIIQDETCIAMRKGKNLPKIITQVINDAYKELDRLNEV